MMNLVWFRTDLRVQDNLALQSALKNGEVIGLYIATPLQWQIHSDAVIKLDFWRRNLEKLETTLADLNIRLLYCQVPGYKQIPAVINEAINSWGIKSLHFNAEYPLNEANRDEQVLLQAREAGANVEVHHDQVLLQPGSVLNNSGQPFKVFTPFARKSRSMMQPGERQNCKTGNASPQQTPPLLSMQVALDEIDWPEKNPAWVKLWPAGEKAALKRLQQFYKKGLKFYKKDRDYPAINGTSTLSPWLNAGAISIRDCWRQACKIEGEGAETWKNELLWREFYKHIIFHYPHISRNQSYRQHLDKLPWRRAKSEFQTWCEGKTGIPIIDAAMRQLRETGWMHNRLRMITAMFLTKHLLIDWRWGEDWFMQNLIDGDFSANNGGWQWSASTGTDSVPYFRIFNPVTQSRRFDEEGDFIRRFIPELANLKAKDIHDPQATRPADYPAQMIDLKLARERALDVFKQFRAK